MTFMVKKCKDKQSLRRVEARYTYTHHRKFQYRQWDVSRGIYMCVTNGTSVEIEIKLLIISTGEYFQYSICVATSFEIKYKTQRIVYCFNISAFLCQINRS